MLLFQVCLVSFLSGSEELLNGVVTKYLGYIVIGQSVIIGCRTDVVHLEAEHDCSSCQIRITVILREGHVTIYRLTDFSAYQAGSKSFNIASATRSAVACNIQQYVRCSAAVKSFAVLVSGVIHIDNGIFLNFRQALVLIICILGTGNHGVVDIIAETVFTRLIVTGYGYFQVLIVTQSNVIQCLILKILHIGLSQLIRRCRCFSLFLRLLLYRLALAASYHG